MAKAKKRINFNLRQVLAISGSLIPISPSDPGAKIPDRSV